MSSASLQSLFAFKTWAQAELFAVLAALPAQHADTVHGCLRTLNHIHVVDRIFRAHLSAEPRPFGATNTPDTPAVALLRVAAAETDAWYEAYVRDLTPEQLAQTVAFTFTDGDRGAMTREEILLHVITHGGYHRGNVGQMLKAIGMAPPRELYTRFLHLREPQRRG